MRQSRPLFTNNKEYSGYETLTTDHMDKNDSEIYTKFMKGKLEAGGTKEMGSHHVHFRERHHCHMLCSWLACILLSQKNRSIRLFCEGSWNAKASHQNWIHRPEKYSMTPEETLNKKSAKDEKMDKSKRTTTPMNANHVPRRLAAHLLDANLATKHHSVGDSVSSIAENIHAQLCVGSS